MEPPPVPNPPPVPFGDPTRVQRENRSALSKGVLFGCGGCGLAVLAVILCGVGFFVLVLGSMRHSDVSNEALAKAGASAEVRALLGAPLEQGWMFTGSISIDGTGGTADVSFPISGPKGSGTIQAKAKKLNGVWIFTTLLVTPDSTGRPIDLLAPRQVV